MNKNNIIIQNNRSGQPCFLAKDNNWYLVQSQLGQRYILHDQKEYELNEHDGKYYLVGDKCYCSLGQVTQYGNQQNTGNNRYPLNNQQYNQQNVQYNNQQNLLNNQYQVIQYGNQQNMGNNNQYQSNNQQQNMLYKPQSISNNQYQNFSLYNEEESYSSSEDEEKSPALFDLYQEEFATLNNEEGIVAINRFTIPYLKKELKNTNIITQELAKKNYFEGVINLETKVATGTIKSDSGERILAQISASGLISLLYKKDPKQDNYISNLAPIEKKNKGLVQIIGQKYPHLPDTTYKFHTGSLQEWSNFGAKMFGLGNTDQIFYKVNKQGTELTDEVYKSNDKYHYLNGCKNIYTILNVIKKNTNKK